MSNRTEQIKAVEEILKKFNNDHQRMFPLDELATAIVDTEIKKAELRGRMAAYQDFFEWECDDCNPEGFAKQRISELEAELKGLGE